MSTFESEELSNVSFSDVGNSMPCLAGIPGSDWITEDAREEQISSVHLQSLHLQDGEPQGGHGSLPGIVVLSLVWR